MCVSCINEPQDNNSSGREKWVVFHRYIGRRFATARIRKLEYLYSCLSHYAHTDLFSSHLFSFSPASSLPMLASSPRLLFVSNILMLETRFLVLVPRSVPLPHLSSSSFNILARTERLLRLAKVYDLYLLSHFFSFLISLVRSSFFSPTRSVTLSPFLSYILFCVFFF